MRCRPCIQGEDARFNYRVVKMKPKTYYIAKPFYQYNFSVFTARNRWINQPDVMIEQSRERYEMRRKDIQALMPDAAKSMHGHFICGRVNAIFYNALDLCWARKVTPARKEKLQQLMSQLELPNDANARVRWCYKQIVTKRWFWIYVIGWTRLCYHMLLKLFRQY